METTPNQPGEEISTQAQPVGPTGNFFHFKLGPLCIEFHSKTNAVMMIGLFLLVLLGFGYLASTTLKEAMATSRGQMYNPPEPGQSTPSTTVFTGTYLFWVPPFTVANLTTTKPPEAAEAEFHQALQERFGGWTRWNVMGSGSTGSEPGWFYLASLSQGKEPLTENEFRLMLGPYFSQRSFYMIHFQH